MLHEKFMRLALREAEKGVGKTSPNPAVGAVIVARTKVIGLGFHRGAGMPHAEIEAIKALTKKTTAKDATLYVTLEPCSTQGRTPPCVDAIIAAGFSRVVIGTLDPNPAHAGRAIELLQKAGIEVIHGILEKECRELNRAFNKWIVTKMPFVIAKAGMTLDARITLRPSENRWITSTASRKSVHALRGRVDAILVGGETLRVDNPRLTVRGIRGAKQPWRVIVSRSGVLPKTAHVFTDRFKERTLVYAGRTLKEVLRVLGEKQITSVLIEGGMRIFGEAFDEKLIDEVHFHVAPFLAGGPKVAFGGLGAGSTVEAAQISNPRYARVGNDLQLIGDVHYPNHDVMAARK